MLSDHLKINALLINTICLKIDNKISKDKDN